MTLLVAKLLATRLRELGAEVSFVRSRNAPVTPKRPDDLREVARAVLKKNAVAEPKETDTAETPKEQSVKWQSELLFYRQSEIRYRARRVNGDLRPDLVLCLHFNAVGRSKEPGTDRSQPLPRARERFVFAGRDRDRRPAF
jgi:N-acetylmuramoyl-L-alanine amidase